MLTFKLFSPLFCLQVEHHHSGRDPAVYHHHNWTGKILDGIKVSSEFSFKCSLLLQHSQCPCFCPTWLSLSPCRKESIFSTCRDWTQTLYRGIGLREKSLVSPRWASLPFTRISTSASFIFVSHTFLSEHFECLCLRPYAMEFGKDNYWHCKPVTGGGSVKTYSCVSSSVSSTVMTIIWTVLLSWLETLLKD